MILKRNVIAKLVACTSFTLAISLGATFAMQDTPEKDVVLDDLVVEFKKTVEGLRDDLAIRYKDGQIPYAEMLRAENDLIATELQLLTDEDDRIAALEKRLKNCVFLEERVAVQVEVADASASDLLKAKTDRLAAQIELVRAKTQD